MAVYVAPERRDVEKSVKRIMLATASVRNVPRVGPPAFLRVPEPGGEGARISSPLRRTAQNRLLPTDTFMAILPSGEQTSRASSAKSGAIAATAINATIFRNNIILLCFPFYSLVGAGRRSSANARNTYLTLHPPVNRPCVRLLIGSGGRRAGPSDLQTADSPSDSGSPTDQRRESFLP